MPRLNGYRTKNRDMMLAYMRENKDRTVYVNDIHEHMKEQGVNINVTTIYRFLDRLQEEKRVLKYSADKGESAGFQYVEVEHNCEDHLHVKCIKCGKVIHLDCSFMDQISGHLKDHHNFSLLCEHSVLAGICEECKDEKTEHC